MRIRFLRKAKTAKAITPLQALAVRLPDVSKYDIDTIVDVSPFTMTSPERLVALCDAVRHVIEHQIPGDIVECGVWRGGSMMAVARSLIRLNDQTRKLWLYDTFDGMSAPADDDVDHNGNTARALLAAGNKLDAQSIWCRSPLDEVKRNLAGTGYPVSQQVFVRGKVEQTIPQQAPESISLLRLDTDWYESTRHELVHLFPRLSPGGILIIDDYGHWHGCRRAVDEYFSGTNVPIFLNRIDYTGRIAIKPERRHGYVLTEQKCAG